MVGLYTALSKHLLTHSYPRARAHGAAVPQIALPTGNEWSWDDRPDLTRQAERQVDACSWSPSTPCRALRRAVGRLGRCLRGPPRQSPRLQGPSSLLLLSGRDSPGTEFPEKGVDGTHSGFVRPVQVSGTPLLPDLRELSPRAAVVPRYYPQLEKGTAPDSTTPVHGLTCSRSQVREYTTLDPLETNGVDP